MQKILGCLLLFLAPCIGCATDCPPLVLTLYSDQGFEMRVLRGDTAPKVVRARLYSGHKLLRILVSDKDGEFRSDPLPEGTYLLFVSSKEQLGLHVRPERSGLHGPFVIWHLFPKTKGQNDSEEKGTGRPCPLLAIKD